MDVAQLVHRQPRAAGAPSWWEKRRRRKEADAWIMAGFAPRYGWRVVELTSRRERRLLARSIRRAVADLSPRRMPGASPLNRVALRPHAGLLLALAGRLDDERPVAAAGILEVQRLLTEPGSPLYARPDPDEAGPQSNEIAPELMAVLEQLDVR